MGSTLVHTETSRDPQLQAQIRDHMKSLGKHKSKGFAIKSAMNGDRAALHTIFSSPPYLCGLEGGEGAWACEESAGRKARYNQQVPVAQPEGCDRRTEQTAQEITS